MTNNGNVAPTKNTDGDYQIVDMVCSGCGQAFDFQARGSELVDYRIAKCCQNNRYLTLVCKTESSVQFSKQIENERFWL